MNLQIIRYAIEAHDKVNHLYDNVPYSVHLSMVALYAQKYIDLIPDVDNNQQIVMDACWLHDTIEDCRLTYNDIKKVAGEQVADIVYAVTNEKGKNRKERANEKYYQGIRAVPWAKFVKIADRLANVAYSKSTNQQMFEMYCKENSSFIFALFPNEKSRASYLPMITELMLITNTND